MMHIITVTIDSDGNREVAIGEMDPAAAAMHLYDASLAVSAGLQEFSVTAFAPVIPRDWRDL